MSKQQVKQDPIAAEALNPAFKKQRFGPKARTVRWAKRRLSRQRRHESNRFMREVWAEDMQNAALDAYYDVLWCEYTAQTLHEEAQADYYAWSDEQEHLADDRYVDDDYDDYHGCGAVGCSYCDPHYDPHDDWHDNWREEQSREAQAKRDLHDSLDAARALVRAYEAKELWYDYRFESIVHDGTMPFELWSACTAFRLEVKELK